MGMFICYTVIFIAEAITAWLYFEHLYSSTTKPFVRFISYAIGYGLLLGLFFVDNVWLNAFMMCVVNTVIAKCNYNCSIKTAILHGVFLEFAIVATEVLMNLIITGFGHDFSAFTYDLEVLIAMAITSKLLYLFVSLLTAQIFRPYRNYTKEPRLVVLFWCLPILSIVMALLITYLGFTSEMTQSSGLMMVSTIFSLLIINLLFLILYNRLQQANEEYIMLQLSRLKEEADTVYYQAMQEQFENQQILIHDIKSHLRSINDLAKDGKTYEIETYVNKLESDLLPSVKAKICSDPILNMMLLRYTEECRAHNVDLQCDIRENTATFMDAPSITTLYGNLLSNALESASTTTERQVEISVTRNTEQSIIIVTVINSCENIADLNSNGFYNSTKKDKAHHGIGLKSIKRIVKKYAGVSTTYYDSESKRFHHIIQFPITQ